MNSLLEQQSLRDHLIREAAFRASAMLADPLEAARLRTPSDCGLTEIERLEHSALAEDQLLAAALRLTAGPAAPFAIEAALQNLFATPPGRLALEAQRRAAFGPVAGQGLPIGRARETAAEIEGRLEQQGGKAFGDLRTYADVYSDLWCDPRIAAPAIARREMLALVSALKERCAPADMVGRKEACS